MRATGLGTSELEAYKEVEADRRSFPSLVSDLGNPISPGLSSHQLSLVIRYNEHILHSGES
jgi:hypothetical protein